MTSIAMRSARAETFERFAWLRAGVVAHRTESGGIGLEVLPRTLCGLRAKGLIA